MNLNNKMNENRMNLIQEDTSEKLHESLPVPEKLTKYAKVNNEIHNDCQMQGPQKSERVK